MKRISQNIMFPYFMFFATDINGIIFKLFSFWSYSSSDSSMHHYAKTFLLRFLADEKKDTDREIDRIRVGLGDKENKIIYREL